MNKKLLSLVIAGALTATSLPVVASAAQVDNTTSINSNVSTVRAASTFGVLLRGGSNLYSSAGGSVVGHVSADTWIQIPTNSTGSWYYANVKGKSFYVRASDVVLY